MQNDEPNNFNFDDLIEVDYGNDECTGSEVNHMVKNSNA